MSYFTLGSSGKFSKNTYSRKRGRTTNSSDIPISFLPTGSKSPRNPVHPRVSSDKASREVPTSTSNSPSPSPRPHKRSKLPTSTVPSVDLFQSSSYTTVSSPITKGRVSSAKFKVSSSKEDGREQLLLVSSEHAQFRTQSPTCSQPQKLSSAASSRAFKRTKSQLQKENVLSQPPLLGPPIQIPLPGGSTAKRRGGGLRSSSKSLNPLNLARRPSADVHSAHISTHTASLHRRPSGSHALQAKTTQNQGWLIPPLPFTISSKVPSRKEPMPALDESLDPQAVNSFMAFSPQCVSTPLPTKFRSKDYASSTPDKSTSAQTQSENIQSSSRKAIDIVEMEGVSPEPVPYPQPLSAEVSPPRNARNPPNSEFSNTPRRTVHLPHDSIFSSFDVSISSPIAQGSLSPPGNASPSQELIQPDIYPKSLGDGSKEGEKRDAKQEKLHTMFSELELSDEVGKWTNSQDSGITATEAPKPLNEKETDRHPGTSKNEKKKKKVRISTELVHDSRVKRPASRKPALKLSPRALRKPQLHLNNEPLVGDENDEDELLLTSKGWDYNPLESNN
ncbi:hypothetical protein M422DRAFT_774258 [Sphaerobolus stellatus SS14]|nr:hypothetical protein M422DRAFT_774258 [Sphaerobolus stellatus SS14]